MSTSLDIELWRRAERVFAAAIEWPVGERSALLHRACGADHGLREAVEALLAFDEADFLGTPLLRPAVALEAEPSGSGIGQSIGPYHLLQVIGEGGMSRVFLARQSGDFPRPVAVKLIREGRLSPAMLRRFRRERRILAELEHPNIARLLDGGATEDGQPYVVMEYVEGAPITRYCDERRLSIRRRLELFRVVCGAVAHAHGNLVIHRDIKPSNVLVTAEGEPKLLDFGIAQRLAPGPDPATDEPTATHERALTPDYASPEQRLGAPLTTASDVYSLGVVLHELLVGCRPRPDREPPSACSSGDRVEAVASQRGLTARQLRRRVGGDLDNIVLRSLHPEPGGRYASVEQLSMDIGRYLDGRPVSARPPALAYRAQKFVRRNAVAVAFGSAAVSCLAAAAGVLVHQGALVRRERDLARRQQARAEEVTRFLVDAFDVADPYQARGHRVTAREILDRSARRVAGSLEGEPVLRATLMDTMGRVYANLGLHQPARTMLDDALALKRRASGEASPEVAETLTHLGLLYHQEGDDRAAEAAFRQALEIRRAVLGAEHALTAESLAQLGYVLRDRGEHQAAEPLIRQALALRRLRLGEDDPEVAGTMTQLGFLLQRKGALGEAEALYREAVASFRRSGRPDHPLAATALASLAWLTDDKGDGVAAEALYREALAVRRQAFGDRHPQVASTLVSLASVLRTRGDYAGAEAAAREALEMFREFLPAGHPELAVSLNNLAVALRDKGEPAAAEPLLREALTIARSALGPDDPDTAAHAHNLGTALAQLGRHAAAEEAFQQALAVRRRKLGPEHWQVGNTLVQLADLRRATGRPHQGEALASEAVRILSAGLPEGHWRTAVARSVKGDCLVALGRRAEARPLLLESLPIVQAAQGPTGYETRRVLERVRRYESALR